MKNITNYIILSAFLLLANFSFGQGNINVTGSATINMVNNVFLTAHDINVQSGDSIIVNNSFLKVGGIISSSGCIDVFTGTLEMNGSSAQTIAGNMFKVNTIKNLIVSNTGGGLSVFAVPKDTLKVKGTLSFGYDGTTLNTGNNITLLSTDKETANVGKVEPGTTINGNVTVERYINIGTGSGQHKKSWQLLSAPTTGQTIQNAWMEGGGAPPPIIPNGYGTWITGAGAGFDAFSATPSMKTYNPDKNNWVSVTNPITTQINNANGYLVFVRGDRSVFNFSGANSSPVTTILRTTGNLLIGDQPEITLPLGKYQSIGNPYASAIDFTKITKTAGVDNKYYVWDPYLYGSYGLGGYQTISSTTTWAPVPGGTPNYPTNIFSSTIQSGQAFMVFTTGSPIAPIYTLSFSEAAKITHAPTGSFARPMGISGNNKRQFLGVSLYTGSDKSSLIADGNIVAFDEGFSNQIDGDDALKIMNDGENFGLKRNGKLLAVEAREMIENTDTLYYSSSNLKQRNYQLRFVPENMESSGLQAYLIDKFLSTETLVSLAQNSEIDIVITGAAGSASAERFQVIFRPMAPLPVTFTSIKAVQKNADIQVDWKVENEMNMNHYVVEKSLDGIHFSDQSTIKAINGNANQYNWMDKNVAVGNTYYRIRSVDMNGLSSYTQIVKVVSGKILSEISVHPNPVIDGSINLRLINQSSGIYGIRLFDPLGQVILLKTIKHTKDSGPEIIRWNNKLAKGIYQLEIIKPGGEIQFIKIMN